VSGRAGGPKLTAVNSLAEAICGHRTVGPWHAPRDQIDYCERLGGRPRRAMHRGSIIVRMPAPPISGSSACPLRRRLAQPPTEPHSHKEWLRRAGNQVHAGGVRAASARVVDTPRPVGRRRPRPDVGMAKTDSERQFSACRNSTDRGPIGPQRYTETPCRPPVDVVHEELLVRREALRVETRRILLKPECFIDTASEHRQSSSRVHQVCREPQPAIS
jgi:hypothetical protein